MRALLFAAVAVVTLAGPALAGFDGLYKGSGSINPQSSPTGCAVFQATIQITGNRLKYNHRNGFAIYDIPVEADGAFHGSAPASAIRGGFQRLNGKVDASGKLTAQIDSGYCGYTLNLTKTGG